LGQSGGDPSGDRQVVAQLGISAADALARLRAHAVAEQRLLGEVARDVVARRLRFTKDA
jgi:hypothetical protein